jgi:iron-sulfur cluster repair protein YtfE (RIC family)
MIDVFTMLEADHRNVEAMLDELADTEEGAEREALVAKLTQALQQHMEFEERAVYPLLEQLDQEMEEEAEVEHGLARDGLAKLTELVAAPGFGAAVEMVKAGIGHHVKDEEQEAFPKLRGACDAAAVDKLGRELLQRKAAAGTLSNDLQAASKDALTTMAEDFGVDRRSSMTKAQLIEALSASVAA